MSAVLGIRNCVIAKWLPYDLELNHGSRGSPKAGENNMRSISARLVEVYVDQRVKLAPALGDVNPDDIRAHAMANGEAL